MTRRTPSPIQRAARYMSPVSLLLLDIDGLKRINDENGHGAARCCRR